MSNLEVNDTNTTNENQNSSKNDADYSNRKCSSGRVRDEDKNDDNTQSNVEHASLVAAHYNNITGALSERFESPIFYLRNFNNWVKSVLIREYTDKIKEKNYGKKIKVLDICSGKGGDMMKWHKAGIQHAVFADIAEVSVQQCEARYEELKRRESSVFSAEFIALDCTKYSLRDKYRDPSIKFDIVSCQFGLHYSFESLSQTRRMLDNISQCLAPGGYFFGTIPNANEIVSRAQKSTNNMFGNRIYEIKLLFDPKNGYPLFGGKYDFKLKGVVDCPEFLVNFKLFVKLAAEYGLELVYKAGFSDFYKDYSVNAVNKQMLHRIMCFESYPAPPGKKLLGEEKEYEHAKVILENKKGEVRNTCLGTMSTSEWEVATIYIAFAFKKCKTVWDDSGKPSYVNCSSKIPSGQTKTD